MPAHDALEYKKGLRMHPYIISLSILTGFRHFGFTGILYGPLILCSGKLLYITVKKVKGARKNFLAGSDDAIAAALKHYNSRHTIFGGMNDSVDIGSREATSDDSTNIGQLQGKSRPSSPQLNVVSETPLSGRRSQTEDVDLNSSDISQKTKVAERWDCHHSCQLHGVIQLLVLIRVECEV